MSYRSRVAADDQSSQLCVKGTWTLINLFETHSNLKVEQCCGVNTNVVLILFSHVLPSSLLLCVDGGVADKDESVS